MSVELTHERPAHIKTLIGGVDRYNPSNCHLLEDFLDEQLANNQYDLLANLALLKLYQFNPNLISPTAVLTILFLSLAHKPFSPDFALAWSLLSDSFVVGAAIPHRNSNSDDEDEETPSAKPAVVEPHGEKQTAERLRQMSSLLQARKFRDFWILLRTGGKGKEEDLVRKQIASLLASAFAFETTLQENIAKEVEASFRALASTTLESFLGDESSVGLKKLVETRKWVLRDSVVYFPSNESNSPTSTLQRERIEIDRRLFAPGHNSLRTSSGLISLCLLSRAIKTHRTESGGLGTHRFISRGRVVAAENFLLQCNMKEECFEDFNDLRNA